MTPPAPSSRGSWLGPWVVGALLWLIIVGGVGVSMLRQHPAYVLDADGFMRLTRVREIVEHGQYPFVRFADSNVPAGETSHWGLPLDLLLMTGATALRPFAASWDIALFFTGFWISPLLFLGTLAIVVASVGQVSGRPGALAAALLLPLSNGSANYALPGRPDHHALLLLLAAATTASLCQWFARADSDPERPLPWRIPVLCAVMLWTSVEAVILTAWAGIVVSGWSWHRQRPGPALRFSAGLAGASLVAVLVEHGRHAWDWHDDSLSLLHVTAFSVLAAALWLVRGGVASPRPVTRTLSLAVAGLAGLAMFLGLNHATRTASGPAGWGVMLNFLDRASSDGMPLWAGMHPPLATLAEGYGLPLLLLPLSLAVFVRTRPLPGATRILIVALTVTFLAMAFWKARFNLYGAALLASLTAIGIARAVSRLRPAALQIPALVLSALFLPMAGRLAADSFPGPRLTKRPCLSPAVDQLLPVWQQDRAAHGDATDRRVFTHLFLGPELLYRWRAQVLGTPNLRNAAAIQTTLRLMTDEPAASALAELRAQGWRHVIIYADPELQEIRFWRQVRPGAGPASPPLFDVLSAPADQPLPDGVMRLGSVAVDPARGTELRLFRLEASR